MFLKTWSEDSTNGSARPKSGCEGGGRAGTALGSYAVIAQIGEGGMGQVYRARDTKLDRDVAIKILPDLFANDPEWLARFQQASHNV